MVQANLCCVSGHKKPFSVSSPRAATAAEGRLSTFGSSIGASLRGWSRLSGGCGGPLTGNTAFLLVFKRTGDSGRILLEVTAAGKLRVLV